MKFRGLLLLLLLPGCAAYINAQKGMTKGATCAVQYEAIINVPKTAWGTSSTAYGYDYPYQQLVGWDWCFVPKGENVRILGSGDLGGFNSSSKVIALKKGCAGSIMNAALANCSGGDSFEELVFPIAKTLPVGRVY